MGIVKSHDGVSHPHPLYLEVIQSKACVQILEGRNVAPGPGRCLLNGGLF